MTQQEILEYNKRCAEFLGKEYNDNKIVTPYTHFSKQNPTGKIWEKCKFHSDWNWIMEVVEAIEALKLGNVKIPVTFSSMHQPMKTEIQEYYDASIVFNINYSNCVVDVVGTMRLFEGFIVVDNLFNKKEAVVQAISQFLIWYNENKTN